MSADLSALRHLEIPDFARFESGAGGLTRLVLNSPHSEAHIYLHGAHLTHFQPTTGAPLLFLSEKSAFEPGKPIRGGIPVCFPWFSARAGRPEHPAHGFARTLPWEVESLAVDGDQGVLAVLKLTASDQTRTLWPHDFVLRLHVAVRKILLVMLEVENVSGEPFQFEEALHTYLAVGDARETSITGLENATYLDKTEAFQSKVQPSEPLRFTAETDRIFPQNRATCVLNDTAGQRQIHVEKSGSATTVVWNPWIAKAAAMADFGDEEWPHMACIETANTGPDAITLAPGAKHSMRAIISLGK